VDFLDYRSQAVKADVQTAANCGGRSVFAGRRDVQVLGGSGGRLGLQHLGIPGSSTPQSERACNERGHRKLRPT
jgi:hypothetical protein